MIQNALGSIVKDLDAFVKRRFQLQESKVALNTLVDNSGEMTVSNNNKLVITLVNLKEESSMLNAPLKQGLRKVNPPIMLEMEVLASAVFENYEEALKVLSVAVGFFHGKNVFTPQNTPGLPSNVQKLTIEPINLNYSELQSLWAANGTHYRPSVLYKVRGMSMDEGAILEETPVISAISDK